MNWTYNFKRLLQFLFPPDNPWTQWFLAVGPGYLFLLLVAFASLIIGAFAFFNRKKLIRWFKGRERRSNNVNKTAIASNNSRGYQGLLWVAVAFPMCGILFLSYLALYPPLIAAPFCVLSMASGAIGLWVRLYRKTGDPIVDNAKSVAETKLVRAIVLNLASHLVFIAVHNGLEQSLAERVAEEKRQESYKDAELSRAKELERTKQATAMADADREREKQKADNARAAADRARTEYIRTRNRGYLLPPGVYMSVPLLLPGRIVTEAPLLPVPAPTPSKSLLDEFLEMSPGKFKTLGQIILAILGSVEAYKAFLGITRFSNARHEDKNNNGIVDHKERLAAKGHDADAEIVTNSPLPGGQASFNLPQKAYLRVPERVKSFAQSAINKLKLSAHKSETMVFSGGRSVPETPRTPPEKGISPPENRPAPPEIRGDDPPKPPEIAPGDPPKAENDPPGDNQPNFDAADRREGAYHYVYDVALPVIPDIRFERRRRESSVDLYYTAQGGRGIRLGQFGKLAMIDMARMDREERDIAVHSFVGNKLFAKGLAQTEGD